MPNAVALLEDKDRDGVSLMPLFKDAREDVRLERWAPSAAIELDPDGGFEILVLEGGFSEGGETYRPQSWLRLPIGAHFKRARGDRQLLRVDQRGSSPSRPGNPAHGLRRPCLARDLTPPDNLIYSGALNATLSCCLACVGSFSASRQDPCWSRRSNDCPSARLTQSFLIRVPCRPVSSSIPHSVLLRRPYCH